MKRTFWPILAAGLILVISLSACGGPTTTVSSPTAAPAQASQDGRAAIMGPVTASALVVPAQTSQMSFLISALVKEVDVQEGDKVKAGQTLIILDTPDLKYAVVQAEAALQSAQANARLQKYPRKTWNGSRYVSLSGPPELRQVADAKVTQAQAALEDAKASLAQGTLVAPYDGTIVKINVVPDELVQPGEIVAVIGTLDHMQIETTDLSERDIAGVKIGQTAIAHVKALNQDLNGKVTAIAPMAQEKDGDWVYKVTIQPDSPPPNLLWGMSVDVEIQTQ